MEKTINQVYKGFNKIIYGAFIALALIFAVRNELNESVIYGGLALVFDPFDTKVPFNKRPLWQRAWLVAHLIILLALFGFELKLF